MSLARRLVEALCEGRWFTPAVRVEATGRVFTPREGDPSLHYFAYAAAADAREFQRLGIRHGDALRGASEEAEQDYLGMMADQAEEGYVDRGGKFLSRVEAAMASARGSGRLDSNDLVGESVRDGQWLDPDGKLHPVGSDTHAAWAARFLGFDDEGVDDALEQVGAVDDPGDAEQMLTGAFDDLLGQGWARVLTERRSRPTLWVQSLQALTRAQRAAVETLAIEREMRLVWELGAGEDSKETTLYEPPTREALPESDLEHLAAPRVFAGEVIHLDSWVDEEGKLRPASDLTGSGSIPINVKGGERTVGLDRDVYAEHYADLPDGRVVWRDDDDFYYVFDPLTATLRRDLHPPDPADVPTERRVAAGARAVIESRGPTFATLKRHKVKLTDEERAQVVKAGAVWHHGPGGEASPAVWKAIVRNRTYFGCNTHRCFQTRGSLKAAIKAFHDVVKETS